MAKIINSMMSFNNFSIKIPKGNDIIVKLIPFEEHSNYVNSSEWTEFNNDISDIAKSYVNKKKEIVVFELREKFGVIFKNMDDYNMVFKLPSKVYLSHDNVHGFIYFVSIQDEEIIFLLDQNSQRKKISSLSVKDDYDVFELEDGSILQIFLDDFDKKYRIGTTGAYFPNKISFDLINPPDNNYPIGVMVYGY
ncbi:hypothetical protein VB796_02260 [Arcicella sp. LKC2W]|uniref:hypothetical protein n=1 Tax=Arcicella sp. LKC2W TaxID=2984198 RepID=UPI002B205BE6|nr:hypothetical protein [Arcicella sp. LKC2W]MEA5457841.1 hypothetical protein [Arcicella sp. LKC2W]